MPSTETILVQVSGPDRPGNSAGLFARLAEADATVGDVSFPPEGWTIVGEPRRLDGTRGNG